MTLQALLICHWFYWFIPAMPVVPQLQMVSGGNCLMKNKVAPGIGQPPRPGTGPGVQQPAGFGQALKVAGWEMAGNLAPEYVQTWRVH